MMEYDRKEAAKRLSRKRKELKLSAADVAQKIGKVPHYYGDIERGTCGMSIETIIALANCLDLSTDYILFGDPSEDDISTPQLAYRMLKNYDDKTQKNAVELLKKYLDLTTN